MEQEVDPRGGTIRTNRRVGSGPSQARYRTAAVAHLLGESRTAVEERAERLGLGRSHRENARFRMFTAEEIEVLRRG